MTFIPVRTKQGLVYPRTFTKQDEYVYVWGFQAKQIEGFKGTYTRACVYSSRNTNYMKNYVDLLYPMKS